MGGNIFKTERMSRQEYEGTCLFISKALKLSNYSFPDSFLDKQDFDDIDIICSNTDAVKAQLNITGCVLDINNDSLLINHKGKQIQVDLIHSSNPVYATNYYSYGMFGAMVGKLFKSQGFKLNDIGLFYKFKDRDVFVTSDWVKILATLSILNPKFTTEEEAFRAITRSPLFKKSIFTDLPEKKLAKAMSRPMYSRFLDYIKDAKDSAIYKDILISFCDDRNFIRRLQCEDITIRANSCLSALVKTHYSYEDFKSRCPDLQPREIAHEYNLLKGFLRTTIMSYFNDRSSQIQRTLSEPWELDMHIQYFGHKVDGIDFRYLPMENLREYRSIEECRIYQERYMNHKDRDK